MGCCGINRQDLEENQNEINNDIKQTIEHNNNSIKSNDNNQSINLISVNSPYIDIDVDKNEDIEYIQNEENKEIIDNKENIKSKEKIENQENIEIQDNNEIKKIKN